MIRTYGLTHIALAVHDPERSLAFYHEVFGVREYYRDEESIHVQGPGEHDIITFQRKSSTAGTQGGIIHFGFRLLQPEDIEAAVAAVVGAGGTITSQGEFSPGLPYAYVRDPDGYEIEIWYE